MEKSESKPTAVKRMMYEAGMLSSKAKMEGKLIKNYGFAEHPELIDDMNNHLIDAIKAKISILEQNQR